MKKPLLIIALCVLAVASGALFAQPGVDAGVNTQGTLPSVNTPATPALPSTAPTVPATPAAPAGSAEGDTSADFGRLDTNADGKISRNESKTDLSINKRFRTLDTNKDGNLTAEEYKASASTGSSVKPQG